MIVEFGSVIIERNTMGIYVEVKERINEDGAGYPKGAIIRIDPQRAKVLGDSVRKLSKQEVKELENPGLKNEVIPSENEAVNPDELEQA